MEDQKLTGPLQGITVVDCTHWWLGPAAGQILGDLGSEVIKIEQPDRGDASRGITNVGEGTGNVSGRSLYFEHPNRNKRGIAINLRTEKGRKIVYELISKADVFITNFRLKALQDLKIDYESLCQHNPRIIYAFDCGWGMEGPIHNDQDSQL